MERLFHSSILSILAIFIIFQLGLVKPEEVQECNGHNITYTEDIMARTRKCYKPIDDPCFLKCLLVEANQLDKAGKPNKEKILKDLRKEILIHVSQRDLYWKGLESCFTDHAWKITGEDEPKCESYGPLDTCWHQLAKKICHGI